nr:PAS domain-containing protein [Stutzerimonas stutzeri]
MIDKSANRRSSLLTCEVLDRSRVLDTLVNNLEGMAYRCRNDALWTMIFVSQGSLGLCGYSAAALVDDAEVSWEQITHPDDRARVRRSIDGAIAALGRFTVHYRIRTAAGFIKWVIERGVAVPDEQGEIVVEGFIEDITAQRAVLEALEQAELRYRSIFENASEGIFQSTRDGRYLAANPALARIYGYDSASELVADLADIERRLYVQPGRREAFCQLMEQHGEVLNFESEVYRRGLHAHLDFRERPRGARPQWRVHLLRGHGAGHFRAQALPAAAGAAGQPRPADRSAQPHTAQRPDRTGLGAGGTPGLLPDAGVHRPGQLQVHQ